MSAVTVVTVGLYVMACCHEGCGVTFAFSEEFEGHRRRDLRTFYCPWGHAQGFHEKTTEEQLKGQLARERAAHDQTKADRDAIMRQRNAARGVTTRLKNRAEAGVCLHCNRTFENLRDHMKTKHKKGDGR